jgi:hypothetical protein
MQVNRPVKVVGEIIGGKVKVNINLPEGQEGVFKTPIIGEMRRAGTGACPYKTGVCPANRPLHGTQCRGRPLCLPCLGMPDR